MVTEKIIVAKTKYGYEATYQEGYMSLSIIRDTKDKAISDLISLWEDNKI